MGGTNVDIKVWNNTGNISTKTQFAHGLEKQNTILNSIRFTLYYLNIEQLTYIKNLIVNDYRHSSCIIKHDNGNRWYY